MKKYNLSASQMLYLAQTTYSTQIYGVKNPFVGMSNDEIKEKIFDASKELRMKNLICEDFDGNLTINSNLEMCIKACTCFDTMMIGATIRNGNEEAIYFFAYDGNVVCLKEVDEEYEIGESSLDEMREYAECIFKTIQPQSINDKNRTSFVASQTIMVNELIEEGDEDSALTLLIDSGCEEKLAEVYVNSLMKKLDSTSFAFVHDEMFHIPTEDYLFIHKENKLIGVSTEIGDDFDDYLVLSEIDTDEIRKSIINNINEFISKPLFTEETSGDEDEMSIEGDA